MIFKLTGLLLVFLFLFGVASPVKADGIVIPPLPPPCADLDCPPLPPRPIAQLVIRYHHVKVKIEDQLAVTRIDQVFYNPNDWAIEGTYVFPLPLDAAVSSFSLWVDGEPVSGEIIDAQEARQYYNEVVRSLRDPALLEYIDRGALRVSLFPIQPDSERKIELEYSQALTAENGLVRYIYPLNTEKFSAQPLESVMIQVEINDRQAIRTVYSPSHPIDVDQQMENRVLAGYEASDILPDTDFSLYYSLGESEAFHLLSYRDPADPLDPAGFFMLLLAPRPGEPVERVDKDVLLVLDRSGSMDGEKFLQAQESLRFILRHLKPQDRFYLQTFSTGIDTYASGLRPASEVNEALAWVNRLSAVGSTDINRALLEAAALVDDERPTYLIFLTDGLPTEGVVDTKEILQNFAASAPENLRLFAFGVGYDVDTVLLDSLSQEHHGLSTYVQPGQPLDEVLSVFYQKISTPVLTNLSLDFDDLSTYDIYPNPLPDLFSNGQVIVVGRYQAGGPTEVILRGMVNGREQTFTYPQQIFEEDSRGRSGSLDMLPRLWATRKIGFLLNRIRLEGLQKEIIEQIVKLSIRYGIVTPYTSYLVEEPMPLGLDAQEQIVEEAFGQAEAAPMLSTGKIAVERAVQEGQMLAADVAPVVPQSGQFGEVQETLVRVVGPRTFVLQDGIWVDTSFDPQQMQVQEVVFLSQVYTQLLDARPDLAQALALSDRVILVINGLAYRILPDGSPAVSVELPPPLPTAESANGQFVSTVAVNTLPTVESRSLSSNLNAIPSLPARSGAYIAGGFILLLLLGFVFALRKRGER